MGVHLWGYHTDFIDSNLKCKPILNLILIILKLDKKLRVSKVLN